MIVVKVVKGTNILIMPMNSGFSTLGKTKMVPWSMFRMELMAISQVKIMCCYVYIDAYKWLEN